MAQPPYSPLLLDLPEGLRNLPTLMAIAALADQAFAPIEQDIYDTSQLLSVETTTDFSYLQGLFDPYGLIDILLGDVADSRKYYRLLKTLYTLKGTARGFAMAMDLLKLTYQEIITQNVLCCTDMTMVLATTNPNLNQFRKVDQLDGVYLPIDTTLTGVTNAPIISATPGPYKVGTLTASKLDYNFTLGISQLGYPLGARVPSVSNTIYFLFWAYLIGDLVADPTMGADSVMDYVFSSDFVYNTAGAAQLDWGLRLGYQDLQQLLPPISTLVTSSYGTDGYAYGDYRLADFLRPNYGQAPSPAPAPDPQVSWDEASHTTCYHALVLGANTLGAFAWQPLGGPRKQVHNAVGAFGAGKLGRNIVLDRVKDRYYTTSYAITVQVEHPAVELVVQYDMGGPQEPNQWTDYTGVGNDVLMGAEDVTGDSLWSIAGAQTSGTVGFAVVGEAIVGQPASG